MSYLALQTNQNILYPWKQIFPLKDNKRYWLWVEIPIIEFRAYFHQTHVHTLKGTCVWISWGNILLLTLYDPICIILKWKKLLNLITSLLLLGYSIGIHQVIFYIFSYFSHKILIWKYLIIIIISLQSYDILFLFHEVNHNFNHAFDFVPNIKSTIKIILSTACWEVALRICFVYTFLNRLWYHMLMDEANAEQ